MVEPGPVIFHPVPLGFTLENSGTHLLNHHTLQTVHFVEDE